MARLPVMLEVGGRRCVVVGGGPVGARRARALVEAGAEVVVVAPGGGQALERVVAGSGGTRRAKCPPAEPGANGGGVTWVQRVFEAGDLDDAFLVVVATDDAVVNEAVAASAAERGVLVNRADGAGGGGLTFMARGEVEGTTVAVDSGGASASAAGRLRDLALEGIGADWPRLLRLARPWRERVQASVDDVERRSAVLRALTGQEAMDILLADGETALQAYWAGLMESV